MTLVSRFFGGVSRWRVSHENLVIYHICFCKTDFSDLEIRFAWVCVRVVVTLAFPDCVVHRSVLFLCLLVLCCYG